MVASLLRDTPTIGAGAMMRTVRKLGVVANSGHDVDAGRMQ